MKRFILSSAALAMAMTMTTTAMAGDGDSKYFKDVTAANYGWAVEYIDYIASNNIAAGVGADMYKPGSNIERGDFAVLVDKTFKFKQGKLETYALGDVAESSYYAQPIANCAAAGVITERGAYYPEDNIKRIDAIKMIYRALHNQNLVSDLSTDISMFNDKDSISGIEAQAAAATLYKIDLVKGDDKGNLNPSSTMTRAEMAVVFAKLDKYIDEYTVEAQKKADEKAEKDKENEVKKEEQKKEEAKTEESRNYSGENVDKPVKASNGGSISVDNSSVVVSGDNAVSISNKSDVKITESNISARKGDAINANGNSTVSIKGGKISADNGNAIYAKDDSEVTAVDTNISFDGDGTQYGINVSDGAKAAVKDSKIEAADDLGAILVGNGGKLELKDTEINAKNGSGKGSYTGAIDIKSTNDKESIVTLENTVIDNKKGAAFYVRESNATINIKGDNKINTATLINSPEKFKEKQERGNNINLNLTDEAVISNTRIILDNMTILNINIEKDCVLGGQFDPDLNGYINLELDYDAAVDLNGDLYLDSFKNANDVNFDNIIDNGYNIYYNELNPDNDWLFAKEYDLLLGGKLRPYTREAMAK